MLGRAYISNNFAVGLSLTSMKKEYLKTSCKIIEITVCLFRGNKRLGVKHGVVSNIRITRNCEAAFRLFPFLSTICKGILNNLTG